MSMRKVYDDLRRKGLILPEGQQRGEIRGTYTAPIVLSLTTATVDRKFDIGGTNVILVGATGLLSIRFNEKDNELVSLNQCFNIITPFTRFYLTWASQAGKVATLIIGNQNFIASGAPPSSSGLSNAPQAATTPTVYNTTMTIADTEYSQLLPEGTKRILAHVQDDAAAYRLAYATGKVAAPTAPYINVLLSGYYDESDLLLSGTTLYFATSIAGKKMELLVWT